MAAHVPRITILGSNQPRDLPSATTTPAPRLVDGHSRSLLHLPFINPGRGIFLGRGRWGGVELRVHEAHACAREAQKFQGPGPATGGGDGEPLAGLRAGCRAISGRKPVCFRLSIKSGVALIQAAGRAPGRRLADRDRAPWPGSRGGTAPRLRRRASESRDPSTWPPEARNSLASPGLEGRPRERSRFP
jgi:hypothetical protein